MTTAYEGFLQNVFIIPNISAHLNFKANNTLASRCKKKIIIIKQMNLIYGYRRKHVRNTYSCSEINKVSNILYI